ncbi:MAG: hypothetical protein K6A94_00915 [Bacteroidales bacterium]|nr:hypothetical protein [Bacteroidales bacterium]
MPIENKVEELAALYFSIPDIALFIGVGTEELRNIIAFEEANPIHIAYKRGKLRTSIRLRFDTARFAMAGNPQASQDMKEYLAQQIMEEDA